MNTLVYGFGPFANFSHNVTVDIVHRVTQLKLAPAVIFETRFSKKMFVSALEKYRPQLVIGLGQDSRARKIRIERKAVNWRKSPGQAGRPISTGGEKCLYVPLKVSAFPGTTITYNAGDYVCNYSMYLMCEYCLNTDRRFAFLHVPLSVNINQAAELVDKIIESSQ